MHNFDIKGQKQNFMFVAFSLGVNMLLQISNAAFTTERDVPIVWYVYSIKITTCKEIDFI